MTRQTPRLSPREKIRLVRQRLEQDLAARYRSVDALQNQIKGIEAAMEIVRDYPDDDETDGVSEDGKCASAR